jgi:hypothetical protein
MTGSEPRLSYFEISVIYVKPSSVWLVVTSALTGYVQLDTYLHWSWMVMVGLMRKVLVPMTILSASGSLVTYYPLVSKSMLVAVKR